ncbi:MAG: phosphatidylserine decarboxylase [Puniceicoccales bacterium]|jgi:phosphatidylserine decarboxylase|nr:phosphatidylserine decarboxylase [Puniceicoccales bacterium]
MRRIVFFNRYTRAMEEEEVFGGALLKFVYTTAIGHLTFAGLCRRKIFSALLGKLASAQGSRRRILPFIEKYGLKADSFERKIGDFTSFNDFFSRKLKPSARPISPKPDTISSPVDGRHLAYKSAKDLSPFFVKGEDFSVEELTLDRKISEKFSGGSVLISRLCPVDYHRFHFPVDCVPGKTFLIGGGYASVNPIAMAGKIETFLKNKRMTTLIRTDTCGDVLMVEIGATGIGSIKQTFVPEQPTLKGSEKGYFECGGSAVILIFEVGRIKFSDDVLANTAQGTETYVLMGDEIATIL